MRRALGGGLSQIIADQSSDGPANEVAVADIVPNARQPRTRFDESALGELAASIREHGVIQPLVVRPLGKGKYELIAGERRLRAARLAGLRTVPVALRTANPQSSLEMALVENIQRADINPVECGRAYRRLIDEFDLTQEQVAAKVGKSRTAITNTLRLLRLPDRILGGLEEGRISEGHARALLGFEDEERQLAVYDEILSRALSVREVERAAQRGDDTPPKPPAPTAASSDPNDHALEYGLSEHLGLPIKLARAEFGGRLTIEFYSDEDLAKIVETLGFHV